MKRSLAGAALAAMLLLGGCASMSSDECLMSDWHTVGYEDGSRGYAADRLGSHRKACAKHSVAPDLRAYQAGREEGLQQFCQPSRGFSLGASGGQYGGVCNDYLEPAFLEAYRSGYHLHNLRSSVNSSSYQIEAKQRELKDIREEMRSKEAALIGKDTSTEERILLLADLKDLSERTGQIDSEIYLLIDERARREEELASYERALAGSRY
ncbi:MAG TPA: DUF2799 domain-containing protein [Burkholderiales bacterium]|nr:DUF2799 domain-containing protein [Burkholderiales bacterium]